MTKRRALESPLSTSRRRHKKAKAIKTRPTAARDPVTISPYAMTRSQVSASYSEALEHPEAQNARTVLARTVHSPVSQVPRCPSARACSLPS